MRTSCLFISIFICGISHNLNSQSLSDTLDTFHCPEEIKYACDGDTMKLQIYSEEKFKSDTTLIRYLLKTKKFTNTSIRRIKRSAFFFRNQSYEQILDGDSILHRIDFALLQIFQIKFFCKTYKGKVIRRGLSLEMAYRSTCIDSLNHVSYLHPKFYPAINILASNVDKDFIGCGLLLIDEWYKLMNDYKRLKKITPGSIYIK